MGRLAIAGRTDPGRWRARNEDSIAWDEKRGFGVLADGMGGHRAGDTASALAVSVVVQRLAAGGLDTEAVGEAVEAANRAVYVGSQRPGFEGMGTTTDVVVLTAKNAIIAHVGDSRVYRWDGHRLQQTTRDHSMVGEMVESGVITPERARNAPGRNIITRAMGLDESVEVDLVEKDARPGDVYLMCSDGLTEELNDNEIAAILSSALPDLERAVGALVAEAKEAGGRDNISAILLRVP